MDFSYPTCMLMNYEMHAFIFWIMKELGSSSIPDTDCFLQTGFIEDCQSKQYQAMLICLITDEMSILVLH